MAVKNSCTPQNIYGPYQHTLFLGWSVMDFTASAGGNEQYSTLTVKLVQDPCAGIRKYLNQSFNWVSANFPNGDPAFNGVIGQAAIFKVEDFEFAGIIQSITEGKGSDGNPTINVSLISPGVILEGTQVIIDGYAGSVNSLPNIVNLFAFLESQNANCPQIGGFGSPAGGFGFARRTDRGIPWLLAKPGLQVLLGGDGHPSYSPYGGIKWKGGSSGYGLIGSDLYILDLSELPTVSSINYRIPGPSATVLELISTVCRDAGYDFYVDLLPAKGGPGGVVTNLIKIRTISRRNQPALGAIQTFVNNRNDIISNSVGQELRADKNSAFIVGGQKRQIYSTYGITPFWGYNDDGGLNTATFIGNQWVVNLDTRALNLSLNTPIGYSIVVDEGEILAAQGDMDTFRDFVILSRPNGDIATYLNMIGIVYPITDLSRGGSATDTHPLDSTVTAGLAYAAPTEASQQDLQTLFNFINSYANDVYGRKWLVQIPWVCVTTDTDTGEYLWSDLPSTEGGWYESTPLLGMPYPSPYTNFFADEQGKVGSILQFVASSGISLEDINNDEYVTDGTYVWVKADLQDRWVIVNNSAYALITTSSPVLYKRDVVTDAYRKVIINSNFRNPSVSSGLGFNVSRSIDKSDVIGEFGVPFVPPFAAAVPILSNTQTYGPWIAAASAKGTVYFEKDDGLVPWEYGSTSYMNLAAVAKINESITEMQTAERGSITMPGYPTIGLGSSINQTITSVVTRAVNTSSAQGGNYYYTSDYSTDNSAAQISNINVTVGPQGVTTQVDISTFTPVFGRFSRGNAERLKQIGQLRYQTYRNIDSKITQAMRVAGAIGRGGRPKARYNTADAHKSSAIVLLGKKYGKRPAVNIPTAAMITAYDDYDQSSLMTLDGIFRPIQKRGGAATGLPKEVESPTPPASQPNYTWAPSPPLNEYTQLVVNTDYLNFLNNPTSGSANRSDTPNEGHDIQGVARSNKAGLAPSSGIFTIQTAIENGGVGYTNDYRYLGLRGPLVVHGWGYDVMGKPVPNASGDSAGSIDSSYANKTDKFKNGWLQDDLTWPAAPVDLRYDRKRGVWTIPPGFRMLKVRATKVIDAGSSGNVIVLNVSDVYDSGGLAIPTGTVLLTNFTKSKICPGDLLAEYDEQSDQYWPLFPGGNTCGDNCSGQACTYTAVSSGTSFVWQSDSGNCCDGFTCSKPTGTPTGIGDIFNGECVQCSGSTCSYTSIFINSSYIWSADSGNCADCGDYICSKPTGTPTATGIKQYGQCKPCEGLGCQFTGISNGMGGFKWSSASGCQDCSNFRCAEPTGNPTGIGQIYNSQCEPCEGSKCFYSGVGGKWVPLSGNCNSSCISGTVQCSEPTGTVINGTRQTGECTPCDEYPCRWVAVGSSWQQTGVGCTGCFDSRGTYECVYPPTKPTSPGEIYTSVCQPPQPTGTTSCTINEIELVCGLSSGIQIKKTPITFTVSGDGMVCVAGQTVITTCDTCCTGSQPPPTPPPTPGDNCGSPCAYFARCKNGTNRCNQQDLYWSRMGYSCKPGCACTAIPRTRPTHYGQITTIACVPIGNDPGGPRVPGLPVPPIPEPEPPFRDPRFNPVPVVNRPIFLTNFPQGGAWPIRDILYNPSIPNGFPGRLEVVFKENLTYNTEAATVTALRTEDYKPVRVLFTGDFFNTPAETGMDSGVPFTGYPDYLSAASTYEVLNELNSVIYTITGGCFDFGCSGDTCSYISTGVTIDDWVINSSCTGCACKCPVPTGAPGMIGMISLGFCTVYTGIDGQPLSGYLYKETNNYKYNIPSGAQATIIHYANGQYRVAEYKPPKAIVSGNFTETSFYDKLFVDASTGNVTITLPSATGNGIDGNTYTIKKIDSSTNFVVITGASSELIDGLNNYILYNQYESASFIANNGTYYVI